MEHKTLERFLVEASHHFVLIVINRYRLIASRASSAGALARPASVGIYIAGQQSGIDSLLDDLAKSREFAEHGSYVSIDRATFGRLCLRRTIVGGRRAKSTFDVKDARAPDIAANAHN